MLDGAEGSTGPATWPCALLGDGEDGQRGAFGVEQRHAVAGCGGMVVGQGERDRRGPGRAVGQGAVLVDAVQSSVARGTR